MSEHDHNRSTAYMYFIVQLRERYGLEMNDVDIDPASLTSVEAANERLEWLERKYDLDNILTRY